MLVGDRPREHGVVPVHRPAGLGLERQRGVPDQRAHHVGRLDPIGPRRTGGETDGGAATQGVLDRRRPREQGIVPVVCLGLDRPQHQPVGASQREHPVECPLDTRPHVVDESSVRGAAPVVPHAGGDVGAHVGVELGFGDGVVPVAIGHVVVVPAAVGALDVGQPLVGPFGLDVEAGDVERHRRLDMVPGVAVATGEPRDHAARRLQRGEVATRLHDLVGRQHAGQVGDRGHAESCGFVA